MNDLQIFNNEEFGEIRTITKDDEVLFCLGDLCRILELTAKGVKQRLTDEVISNYPIPDSLALNPYVPHQAHMLESVSFCASI